MNTKASLGFWSRARHQFMHEWRAQWGLVVVWVGLLVAQWWHWRAEAEWRLPMPDSLPGLLALLILVRSVRADAPGNVEIASHTRPVGRGAVFAGKVAFLMLALLLPWIVRGVPQGYEMGFGVLEWLGVLFGWFLPAMTIGSLAAFCAAAGDSGRKAVICGLAGFAVFLTLFFLFDPITRHDAKHGAWTVASVLWSMTMLFVWWRMSLRRDWVKYLVSGVVLAVLVVMFWRYDWREVPPRAFTEAKLALHVGERPDAAAQELWPGLFVTGLPPDHVVSILECGRFSDYLYGKKNENARKHWMTQAHTRALLPHYPAGSLWHGNVDLDEREALKKYLDEDPKSPLRVKLAVQRMERVLSMPMKQRKRQSVILEAGRRLDFGVRSLNDDQKLSLWARLHEFYPYVLPRPEFERRRPWNGAVPKANFLALLHSPSLREVRTACEGDWSSLFYQIGEPKDFSFTHPRPQMDIAGLTLEKWLADSVLDLWLPRECGVVELTLSAEELRRLLEKK